MEKKQNELEHRWAIKTADALHNLNRKADEILDVGEDDQVKKAKKKRHEGGMAA